MHTTVRRSFLKATAGLAAAGAGLAYPLLHAQEAGERPSRAGGAVVCLPRKRVPVSLIIDDSTCLVNLAHFGIPHFHEAFPDKYPQDWRKLPREIPDSFVRKFAAWCHEHGVKGKYSVVPYPACVGWLDRDLPGWSKRELLDSLALVRNDLAADWDFHPEMVSHTWVIDTKTGRPYPERNSDFMENWGWTNGKSADQIATYMAYALTILKNVGIPCEGITTPGGFGSGARKELSQATLQACRAVFNAEIPHYFRDLFTDATSVAPRVEYAAGLASDDPRCSVSIIGCTGDWFGGWDGLEAGSPDLCITGDLSKGRLIDVIARGEPAIIVCHWPGIYFNGQETGFNIFKEVVTRLHARYDNLLWMKLSEIARYWAAKELTAIEIKAERAHFQAPFRCPSFTVTVPAAEGRRPFIGVSPTPLREVADARKLERDTFLREPGGVTVCFDLPKGRSQIALA